MKYPELYALIGDNYMTVASTSMFKLPDMRSRVLVPQADLPRSIFPELYDAVRKRLDGD